MKGKHLIVDGKMKRKIGKGDIAKAFREIPPKINMEMVSKPLIFEDDEHNPGITGLAIIDYSHISIHTFERTNRICVDVFSCRNFCVRKALNLIRKILDMADERVIVIEREV